MERKSRSDYWGIKWPNKSLDGTRFNGATSPMWMNPYPKFFLVISLWHLIAAVGTIAVYIFLLDRYDDCDLPLKPFLLAKPSLGIIEFLVYLGYSRTQYASDVEWSKILRNTFILFALTLLQVLACLIMALILLLPDFPQICREAEQAWTYIIWQASVGVTGCYLLVSVITLLLLIVYAVEFYLKNNETKFYYKSTREIMILD